MPVSFSNFRWELELTLIYVLTFSIKAEFHAELHIFFLEKLFAGTIFSQIFTFNGRMRYRSLTIGLRKRIRLSNYYWF